MCKIQSLETFKVVFRIPSDFRDAWSIRNCFPTGVHGGSGTTCCLTLKYSTCRSSGTTIGIEIGSLSLNIILEVFRDQVRDPPWRNPEFLNAYISAPMGPSNSKHGGKKSSYFTLSNGCQWKSVALVEV